MEILIMLRGSVDKESLVIEDGELEAQARNTALWWWKNVLKRGSAQKKEEDGQYFGYLTDPSLEPSITEDGKPFWRKREERERLLINRLKSWMAEHSFLPPVRSLEEWLLIVRKEADFDMSITRGKRTEPYFLVTNDSQVREMITKEATSFYYKRREEIRKMITEKEEKENADETTDCHQRKTY